MLTFFYEKVKNNFQRKLNEQCDMQINNIVGVGYTIDLRISTFLLMVQIEVMVEIRGAQSGL